MEIYVHCTQLLYVWNEFDWNEFYKENFAGGPKRTKA